MTARKSTNIKAAPLSPAEILKRETARAKREHSERQLLRDIRACHLPEPQTQHRWHPTRDYRADFAYPDPRTMLLVEVDGGLNVGRRNRSQQAMDAQLDALTALAGLAPLKRQRQGGHNSAEGYEHDRIRDAEALALGWTVLRVTPAMIERGEAVAYIERILHTLSRRHSSDGNNRAA